MAEATRAAPKSPDGKAPQESASVAARVSQLREQAHADPHAAREEAWRWIEELGRLARADRERALAQLQEMFLCGRPAEGIGGQTEGLLVTWTMHQLADRVIGALTDSWMPWLGKRFDPERKSGVNTLSESARWPAKILWPLYSTTPSLLGRSAFDFTTYVEAGRHDPSVDVLVIDYASVDSNPRLVIKSIRDELVEVAPGAHLGKMLWRQGSGEKARHTLLAFFALKSELPE